MKNFKILFFLFLIPSISYSQWIHRDLLTKPTLDTSYNNKFSFQADLTGFFKNNEYNSPFAKGETHPGIQFIPRFGYQVDNKFRFEIGSSGLYYSGDQKPFGKRLFNAVHVRMQYDITPYFNFILGNYYGGVNHRLIEPLYRWERYFVDTPESGVQLFYEDSRYFADIWLNWQRFIEKGDPQQEVLTFGFSSSARLTKPNSVFEVSVPLQLVINHKGGQIDTSHERNLVIGNLATGITTKLHIDHKFFDAVCFDFYTAGYYDNVYIREKHPYKSGWGIYPVASAEASGFKFMMGYWHAHRFYSVDGESLFASFCHNYPDKELAERNLVTHKLSYSRKLLKSLSFGTQIELYTDLDRKGIDYSFGIHLRFGLPGIKWK